MFRVGDEFKSYADLKEKLSEFERTEFVQVNVQRSKSVELAKRKHHQNHTMKICGMQR